VDRSELVIVALPVEDDYVRKISSETEPHLTILYLGNQDYDASQMELLSGYIEHAASSMRPFFLDVKDRGVLGDKNADVLFFDKTCCKTVERFRNQLLSNDLIRIAYESTEQFPEWTPHLTLGYPTTPAKKDDREHPVFSMVQFDRVALWVDDSIGPTFKLEYPVYDMEVAMSHVARGRTAMNDILAHHGVKGMKWGVRKSDGGSGGSASSDDAREFEKNSKRIQTHGTRSLSNKELQSVLNRMNMENQYHNLLGQNRDVVDSGYTQAKKILNYGKTIEEARKFLETPTGKRIKSGIFAAATVGAAYATGGASSAAAAGAQVAVRRASNHYTNTGN
jgi:2'-5' RNA ligase